MTKHRVVTALIAALACIAVTAGSASAAPGDAQWINGNTSYTYGNSCIILGQPTYEPQVGGFTGYWGKPDVSYPKIGDRYWGHIYYTVTGLGCGFGIHGVQAEIALPQGTSLAIDPASQSADDKIQCFRTNLNGTETNVTNAGWVHPDNPSIKGKYCDPTQVSQGANGSVLSYALLAQGQSLHIVFPLRSTKKLSGIAEPNNASKMTSTISEPGITTTVQPYQWNFVGDRPVEVSCPALGQQTTTAIADTTAHAKGFLCNWYRTGKAQFEIREGTAGAFVAQATGAEYPVDGKFQAYYMDQDWNNLKPGTDYQWRLRFTDTKGTQTTGDDQLYLGPVQTFKTTGAAPAPGTGGTPGAGGGGTTGDGGGTTGPPPPADTGTGQQPGNTDQQAPGDQGTPGDNKQPEKKPEDQQPQRDTTAPSLTTAIGKARLGDVLKKGLKATGTCSESCTVKAQLQIDAKTAKKLKLGKKAMAIGAGSAAAPNGGKFAVPVKLTAKARKALKRAKSVKVTLVVTGTDAAGNVSAPATKPVTLKR
jgi:hypothetical protein